MPGRQQQSDARLRLHAERAEPQDLPYQRRASPGDARPRQHCRTGGEGRRVSSWTRLVAQVCVVMGEFFVVVFFFASFGRIVNLVDIYSVGSVRWMQTMIYAIELCR